MPATTKADKCRVGNTQQLLLHFTARTANNYQVSDLEEISSIASLNSDISIEAFEAAIAERDVLANKDFYRGKLDASFRKYRAYFTRFLEVYCLSFAENFISNLPKVKYDNINCELSGVDGYYDLEYSKVNKVLQDPIHRITIDQVIILANQLGVGKIKATYTGERSQLASYGDCGGSSGDWIFSCQETRAWADYSVTLTYEHGTLSTTLMSLKFSNRAPTHRYQIHGGDIFGHADNARVRAAVANGMKISDFLKSYWEGASLVKDSVVIEAISNDNLKQIIKDVASYVFANTNDICKQFKQDLLNNKSDIYCQKLHKLDLQFQLILKYAMLAGIEEADLNVVVNPVARAALEQDIINFSLAESPPEGSRSVLNKYHKKVDNIKQQLEKLLSPGIDSDISSDEESNAHRPSIRI